MNENPTNINPTNQEFAYSVSERTVTDLEKAMETIQNSCPYYFDAAISAQIMMDINEMSADRFSRLFTPVIEQLKSGCRAYDEEHPDVFSHMPPGESALPNWRAVLTFTVDGDLLIDMQEVSQQAQQAVQGDVQKGDGPEFAMSDLVDGHNQLITDVNLVGLYHSYHPKNEEDEIVCGYHSSGLFESDYVAIIQKPDITLTDSPNLYNMDSKSLRQLLSRNISQKVRALQNSGAINGGASSGKSVFNRYLGPLLHVFHDFRDLGYTEAEDHQSSEYIDGISEKSIEIEELN